MPGDSETSQWRYLRLAAYLASLAAMILLVAFASKPLFYDEPWYLNTVGYLNEFGFSHEFFAKYPGYAGPLITFVHSALEPITHLHAPGVRLVSVGGLIVCLLALAWAAKSIGAKAPWLAGLSLLAIPMVWGSSTLAMTETPAIALGCLGVAAYLASLKASTRWSGWGLALAGGILFSLGITGRQTFLAAIPALALVGLSKEWRAHAAFFVVGSLMVAGPLFLEWGGLSSQFNQARVAANQTRTFNLAYGFLSFGYGAIAALILSPRLFSSLSRKWLILAFAGGIFINLVAFRMHFLPALGIAQSILPDAMLGPMTLLGGSIFFGIGSAFAGTLLHHMWVNQRDSIQLALLAAAGILFFTPVCIAHTFGGRYVFVALPFLLLACLRYQTGNEKWRFARHSIGIAAGIAVGVTQLYIVPIKLWDTAWAPELHLYFPHLLDAHPELLEMIKQ
ncbi:MAG: hypothetical protein R3F11_28200 [Verrucomicrobiales bacterium]